MPGTAWPCMPISGVVHDAGLTSRASYSPHTMGGLCEWLGTRAAVKSP